MLAGRRLFLGETDYKTVKLVQRANIPRLSPLNQYVDEGIEEVLFKALTRDPAERYQSAREFGDRMSSYLAQKGVKFTAYDMAGLVTGLTSDQAKWQPREDSVIDRLIQQELMKFTSIESGGPPSLKKAAPLPRHTGAFKLDGEGLENPAEWFTRESEFPSPMPTPQTTATAAEPERDEAASGATVEESEAIAPEPAPNPAAEPAALSNHPVTPPPPPPDGTGAAAASSDPELVRAAASPDKGRKGGGMKYVLMILFAAAAVAAGAAAWFTRIIPH
jgi:eukaryotic-like serine/threonine-protein kinase